MGSESGLVPSRTNLTKIHDIIMASLGPCGYWYPGHKYHNTDQILTVLGYYIFYIVFRTKMTSETNDEN